MDRESLARLLCESIERHGVGETHIPMAHSLERLYVHMEALDLLAVAEDVLAAMKEER